MLVEAEEPTAEEASGGIYAECVGVERSAGKKLTRSAERYVAVEKLLADHGFPNRVVEVHEPVLVQAFRPELAIEAFDGLIVICRGRPIEVQRDAHHVCPQIEVSGDELAALIYRLEAGYQPDIVTALRKTVAPVPSAALCAPPACHQHRQHGHGKRSCPNRGRSR